MSPSWVSRKCKDKWAESPRLLTSRAAKWTSTRCTRNLSHLRVYLKILPLTRTKKVSHQRYKRSRKRSEQRKRKLRESTRRASLSRRKQKWLPVKKWTQKATRRSSQKSLNSTQTTSFLRSNSHLIHLQKIAPSKEDPKREKEPTTRTLTSSLREHASAPWLSTTSSPTNLSLIRPRITRRQWQWWTPSSIWSRRSSLAYSTNSAKSHSSSSLNFSSNLFCHTDTTRMMTS